MNLVASKLKSRFADLQLEHEEKRRAVDEAKKLKEIQVQQHKEFLEKERKAAFETYLPLVYKKWTIRFWRIKNDFILREDLVFIT